MKSILTTVYLIIFVLCGQAQSKFEPGYFIDQEGQKTECLIKNDDWKNNPRKIEYKTNLSSKSQEIGIDDLLEFGIDSTSKYVKHKVIVDKFDERMRDIHLVLNYDYQEDTVLLKVLIEGKASLYLYEASTFRRYFFSTEELPPEQLIYKSFKRHDPSGGINKLINTKLEYNRLYRLQLYDHLKCEEITPETIVKVKFKKNSLIRFFNTYNYCQGSKSTNFHNLKKRNQFNFTPRVGLGLTKLNSVNRNFNSFNFSNRFSYKIGFVVEYILPYNNGRWSLTLEPAFINISQSDSISTAGIGTINYNAIQIPIGLQFNHRSDLKTKC